MEVQALERIATTSDIRQAHRLPPPMPQARTATGRRDISGSNAAFADSGVRFVKPQRSAFGA
ncbi:hypothetical protein WT56_18365 [Burkholderia pseudomultivorans]|uniref:Uncharacterized protein n=2 Tax=Burkholderia pseudomultivorans TaxID=1207504 RepID=A0A132EEY3_9BURK|nr:hypothetical protein WT56_18365 [Burkholderia pseudomultivorans]